MTVTHSLEDRNYTHIGLKIALHPSQYVGIHKIFKSTLIHNLIENIIAQIPNHVAQRDFRVCKSSSIIIMTACAYFIEQYSYHFDEE